MLSYSLTFPVGNRDVLENDQVQISTPLAAGESETQNKPHGFYASPGSPLTVQNHFDGKSTEFVSFFPGTKLDAATLGGKAILFYRQAVHPYGIATMEYDGKAWEQGHNVVAWEHELEVWRSIWCSVEGERM